MLQKLPIGLQTFSEIIEENYLYVDKTKNIYELISTGKTYFFSRPRRFGKSLLISTLEEIFTGNKKLFKNLYLETANYDWKEYPVIRIDFSSINKDSVKNLEIGLTNRIESIAKKYQIKLKKQSITTEYFRSLIIELSKINKVVVLFDEYDSPLIHHIGKNPELAIEIKEFLKSFYTILKTEDQYLKFVFLTGISKFSKVGVFSGLNQLQDISMDRNFCDLVGWTQEELENNFVKQIQNIAQEEQLTVPQTIEKIKNWYNGYRFSEIKTKVYNPFSTLLLFNKKLFKFHWFETGTPSFLLNLVREQEYDLSNMKHIDELDFSSYEVDNLKPLPLLFQTGYLTIADYDKEQMLYALDFPNFEVKSSFIKRLVEVMAFNDKDNSSSYIIEIIQAIKKNNLEEFFRILKIFFANIPYEIHIPSEKYYQSIFYLVFTLIGLRIQAEVRTNFGRIDAVIELEKATYIFEFKLNGTKEKALAQIKEKKYYEKYCCDCRDVLLKRLYETDNSESIKKTCKDAPAERLYGPENCHPGSGPGSTSTECQESNSENCNIGDSGDGRNDNTVCHPGSGSGSTSTENIKSNIPVYLIGVEFDNKERNVGEWVMEKI